MDELERRLALLRAPKASSVSAPPSTAAPPHTTPKDDDLEARLACLDPPKEDSIDVPVEIKNVDDDEVNRFLALAASSPPSTLPPPPSSQFHSQANRQLNSVLSSYESTASTFSSPIEVAFFGRSSSNQTRTLDEDDALIARLQDELKVEKKVAARGGEEGKMGELEKRLEGLKGFRTADGSGRREGEGVSSTANASGLGPPPIDAGLEELRKKMKKGHKKRLGKKHSDEESEEEDSSEEDTESEEVDSEDDQDSDR